MVPQELTKSDIVEIIEQLASFYLLTSLTNKAEVEEKLILTRAS